MTRRKKYIPKWKNSVLNWLLNLLCRKHWPQKAHFIVVQMKQIDNRVRNMDFGVRFPLFDPLFGHLPFQLQDALKCQQCHKQFRSKAGLNYHTMAEHTIKVHYRFSLLEVSSNLVLTNLCPLGPLLKEWELIFLCRHADLLTAIVSAWPSEICASDLVHSNSVWWGVCYMGQPHIDMQVVTHVSLQVP